MKIVIPCDFTEVVDFALRHAMRLASVKSSAEYILLHIIDPASAGKIGGLEERQKQLESYAQEKRMELGIDIKGLVKEGTIGNAIPEYAEELRANIIVMGTHGISGMQKFFGSKAVKVITGSNVPFLAIQSPPISTIPYREVIMPVGHLPVENEKLKWAISMAQEYGLHFNILAASFNDPKLNIKVNAKVALLQRAFDDHGLAFTLHTGARGNNIRNEMESLAVKVNADLFLIMITQSMRSVPPFIDTTDQNIIANSLGIPVLCLNHSMVLL